MAMLRVGAEQLRRELANLLARVGYAGDRVIVERHGSPQAVLIPYPLYERFTEWLEQAPGQLLSEEELHEVLIAQGLIRASDPGVADKLPRPQRRLIQTKGKPLSEVIIEERR